MEINVTLHTSINASLWKFLTIESYKTIGLLRFGIPTTGLALWLMLLVDTENQVFNCPDRPQTFNRLWNALVYSFYGLNFETDAVRENLDLLIKWNCALNDALDDRLRIVENLIFKTQPPSVIILTEPVQLSRTYGLIYIRAV
jgi:hypothetical protein